MLEYLTIGEGTIAFDIEGSGPLVVLAHGMGDTRRSYRFLVPELVAAGYRVANVDIRGCGDSSATGWLGYTRADIAGDLVAVVRHLGGPAVIVGQSISGGAATIAAATAPELFVGVVELAPFTRKQSFDLLGTLRSKRVRNGATQLMKVMMSSSLKGWMAYLDIAIPTKPADWAHERAYIEAMLREPDRMAVLNAMTKTSPVDAGEHLAGVRCPVLIVEGSADPDWVDPRAEGEKIIADLSEGLGELAVIDGAGHYPHAETPKEVLALLLPFLRNTLTSAATNA
ncbi:alpha/beta fold hydrolase [Nesterenkonia lutea]|uniref:Pimeloyl-ACP methyl ester carboxylesterase n=1 Tax=Nesterenkonia lutea TaxID=272919 RepID=A0ABR9JFC5_9MICC|nr:alpha/beta hydrolase [Nesterenkonia lutea]MBE1524629.1 pimeloyl-ACP methyl ester carboxylesterase [Nesterenkonia lutea]